MKTLYSGHRYRNNFIGVIITKITINFIYYYHKQI